MPTEIVNAFTSGLTGVETNIESMLALAVPVVLGLLALTLAIRFGVRFVKSYTGKV